MKRLHLFLMAFSAIVLLASCHKDEAENSDPTPVDEAVTITNNRNYVMANTSVSTSELASGMQKAYERYLSDDGAKVTVTPEVLGVNIKIKTTQSKVSDVIYHIGDATSSIDSVVDKAIGIIDVQYSLTAGGSSIYDYAYKTCIYDPVGNWRTTFSDGNISSLFVKTSFSEDNKSVAYLTYMGYYRKGTVEWKGKKQATFTATDDLASEVPLKFAMNFDGGVTDSFSAECSSDTVSEEEEITFKKIENLRNEESMILEYTVEDPQNELPALMGDKSDQFKKDVAACNVEIPDTKYDSMSFWDTLVNLVKDTVGKFLKVKRQYEKDYPDLVNTHVSVTMVEYTKITDGKFEVARYKFPIGRKK